MYVTLCVFVWHGVCYTVRDNVFVWHCVFVTKCLCDTVFVTMCVTICVCYNVSVAMCVFVCDNVCVTVYLTMCVWHYDNVYDNVFVTLCVTVCLCDTVYVYFFEFLKDLCVVELFQVLCRSATVSNQTRESTNVLLRTALVLPIPTAPICMSEVSTWKWNSFPAPITTLHNTWCSSEHGNCHIDIEQNYSDPHATLCYITLNVIKN